MRPDLTMKPIPQPLMGVVIDTQDLTASCYRGLDLERTLDGLWARRVLEEIVYPGADEAPLLTAFPASGDLPEAGFLLRPVAAEGTSPTIPARLAAILARLATLSAFPAELFAQTAMALRASYAGSLQAGRPVAPRGQLAGWQFDEAVSFMDRNLATSFTTASVAVQCGMSASRFSAAFRKSAGMSLRQWVIHRRVRHAQELLAQEDGSLEEVAVACGFGEQCHFTRQFARIVGMPPGAWRRQLHTLSV